MRYLWYMPTYHSPPLGTGLDIDDVGCAYGASLHWAQEKKLPKKLLRQIIVISRDAWQTGLVPATVTYQVHEAYTWASCARHVHDIASSRSRKILRMTEVLLLWTLDMALSIDDETWV